MHRCIAATLIIAACGAAEDAAWIRNPAIAPDGSRIAFACGGQIWVVPAAGGEAMPLTDGTQYSTRPVWSPDGTRIAFACTRFGNPDVFIMPAEGGRIDRLTWNSAADLPLAFTPDGGEVYVSSGRLGDAAADALGSRTGLGPGMRPEQLYAVPVAGGRARMVLPVPALEARPSRDGRRLLCTDHPSIENEWRKHHVSDAARDIWLVDLQAGLQRRLTDFRGEDRSPVWTADGRGMCWLSERSGSFNVWRQPIDGGTAEQLTRHSGEPVRFLSAADDGTLVYAWDGGLWRLPAGTAEAQRVPVRMRQGSLLEGGWRQDVSDQASELAVSPDRSAFAIIARGEVFVVDAANGATRRITATPAAERNVSFSPDGRSLLYASERDGTWGIWRATLRRVSDGGFTGAAPFTETRLVGGAGDAFQPVWSPDGTRIAYRHDRNAIRVLDLASGASVEVLPREAAYSYSDDDLNFAWSPDGRWIATRTGFEAGNCEIELLDAAGVAPRRNISRSGYMDLRPSFSADGAAVLWLSDRSALRGPDASAAQLHVHAAWLTPAGWERHRRPAAEEAKAATTGDLAGIERRTQQLSPFSADLAFYRLTGDGRRLAIVTATPQGMLAGYLVDLGSGVARPLFQRPPVPPFVFATDAKATTLYALGAGRIDAYDLGGGAGGATPFAAVMERDARGEIAAIFEHAAHLTATKFYDARMHGVDWTAVVARHRRFLPGIRHWEELAELLSEMSGELNASHQGASFHPRDPAGDATASLGLYYDGAHAGDGLRIAAILPGGPADRPGSALRP
ncbi:MAG: PD40 domain-containing protein, partial [Planctomycetes bacterium]|nr:PD40 domain-containing protein [Planctomycetota bacterium]